MAHLSVVNRRLGSSSLRGPVLAGVAIFAASLLLSCSPGLPGESGEAASQTPPTALRVEPARITSSPAFPGRTLRVLGSYSGIGDREVEAALVKFKSSDPAVASVSPSGDVLFLQPGIATIVVTFAGLQAIAPVEIRTPPIALEVLRVSQSDVTVVVDKLRPGQSFRIFGTTDLEKGVTRVTECLRLDLLMKNATPLAEVQLEDEGVTHTEVIVPLPANAKALALQVVTSDCAISPEVAAAP